MCQYVDFLYDLLALRFSAGRLRLSSDFATAIIALGTLCQRTQRNTQDATRQQSPYQPIELIS
jgi:hypothetical protein